MRIATCGAAFVITAIAASFSLSGLAELFSGAAIAAMLIGGALEGGKLVLAGYLHAYWSRLAKLSKLIGLTLVACAMAVNIVGVNGFLSAAHERQKLDAKLTGASALVRTDSQIAAIERRIGELNDQAQTLANVAQANATKATGKQALAIAASSRKQQADIVAQREVLAASLVTLKSDRTRIEGEQAIANAKLGPARALASTLDISEATAVQLVTAALSLLPDLLAVFLVVCATKRPAVVRKIADRKPRARRSGRVIKLPRPVVARAVNEARQKLKA